MTRKQQDYSYSAVAVEGGILPPAFLQKVSRFEAPTQSPTDYQLSRSLSIKDEIGRFWHIARDLWIDYRDRRERRDLAPIQVSVEDWLLALLQEVLGYKDITSTNTVAVIGERRFPISHTMANATVPLVLTTRDHDLEQNHICFGDEDRRRSPHHLLQEYLNAENRCLWGIVANGERLRLLRNNPSLVRPAYVEVDLARLFEENLFADFALFWLLCHTTRLTPRKDDDPASCILESWRERSHETGERALEKLRLGVETALKELGNGFLEQPANETLRQALQDGELDAQSYYQRLLRLVYRLLFLLTAEDRDLLFSPKADDAAKQMYSEGYSLSRLRQRALKRSSYDRYGDLWESLKITFGVLAKGAEPLGLPALDGLFRADQCPLIDKSAIANQRLLAAVRALAYFQADGHVTRVNYRDISSEELGSVYESLLDLQPMVEVAPWQFKFLSAGDDGADRGSARKLTGSYYTPPSLVAELIQSALAPVIEQTRRDNCQAPREALLKLKVIDPACGSGHFLLAAARHLANELAALDARRDTADEALRRRALREVVQHCIYGVDINPLAVELCQTALWLEAIEPGKPLPLLDAHIRCGNALVGVLDPSVLAEGIPDEAYKPLSGDDRVACSQLKKRNSQSREGAVQGDLFDPQSLQTYAQTAVNVNAMPEDTLDDIHAKRAAQAEMEQDADYQQQALRASLWVGAFFAGKAAKDVDRVPVNEDLSRVAKGIVPRQGVAETVMKLAATHRFFHWRLAFPEVFEQGGFDVVLGNPPWERIKIQEQEFFAFRSPSIANARNRAERQRLIAKLHGPNASQAERGLYTAFQVAKRAAEATSLYVRTGGSYPLTGVGDVNTYALFAERCNQLRRDARRDGRHGPSGRAGFIVPTGIATDDSTKAFFSKIIQERQLISLFDYENKERLFAGVHRSYKLCLLTLGTNMLQTPSTSRTRFMFFATRAEHINDSRREFNLSAEEIKLINPNTYTCPVFRSKQDAELTKKIYRRVPVLVDEAKGVKGNPWGMSFMRMFDMSNDSHLFKTAADLDDDGAERDGVKCITPQSEVWLPLYEAKMIHHYDHRWATYEANGKTSRYVTDAEKADVEFQTQPHYWVAKNEVERRLASKGWNRQWLMGWRSITNATNERSVIADVMPLAGIGNSVAVLFPQANIKLALHAALAANLSAFSFDFVARQKLGGTNFNFFIAKQLPVLAPSNYTPADLDFIVPRVVELMYTSHNMQPFARDLGYHDKPFVFDPERRAVLRAELDAYFASLYGFDRDELRYILDPTDVYGEDFPSETFRVLKNREMKEFGEYRTRRLIIEAYDRLHTADAVGFSAA